MNYNTNFSARTALEDYVQIVKAVFNRAACLQFGLKLNTFHTLDPSLIIEFFHSFKILCDSNRIYESTALCPVLYLINMSSVATQTALLSLDSKRAKEIVKSVLPNYYIKSPTILFRGMPRKISSLKLTVTALALPNQLACRMELAETFWMEVLRCFCYYDKYLRNGKLFEGFPHSIRRSMASFGEVIKSLEAKRADRTISLRKLQDATKEDANEDCHLSHLRKPDNSLQPKFQSDQQRDIF